MCWPRTQTSTLKSSSSIRSCARSRSNIFVRLIFVCLIFAITCDRENFLPWIFIPGKFVHPKNIQTTVLPFTVNETALKKFVNLCRYIIVCKKVPFLNETFLSVCLSVCSHRTLIYDDASCVWDSPTVPIEELLKTAATGDIHTVDEVISTRL